MSNANQFHGDPSGINAPSNYLDSMSSFSGADIRVVIAGVTIGEVQMVSWSVAREKGGNFVLGDENARSFSRGRRFIGGSLMFGFFSREALIDGMKSAWGVGGQDLSRYFEWKDSGSNLAVGGADSGIRDDLVTMDPRNVEFFTDDAIRTAFGGQSTPRELFPVRYADQILPFNITLVAANEYGVSARMAILGVEIVNCESGVAIETMQMDHRYTFFAREVVPWTRGTSPRNS